MNRGSLVILMLLLAFALGAVLFEQGPSTQYRAAIEALRLETAGKMSALKVVFWYGLAAIALFGLAAGVGVLLLSIWQRSRLIRPDDSGLYPVVRERAPDGRPYYHDPNRQVAGSVAYHDGLEGIEAQLLLPAGMEEAQLQVTTQAQAAQVVAAGRGRGMSRTARRTVERMTRPRPRLPMPAVMVVQGELADPDDRRLAAAIRQDWEEEGETWEEESPPIRSDT